MPRPAGTVTVEIEIRPRMLRRIDAAAANLGIDRSEAVLTALTGWLQEEERNMASRDRMLKVRGTASSRSRSA